MARPPKFNDVTREKILKALRGGNYRNVACEFGGIAPSTLSSWLRLAEDPSADPEYQVFAEEVRLAEAQAEVADIAMIRQHGRKDWRAIAHLQAAKNPQRWGRRETVAVELGGPDGGPIDVRVNVGADPETIQTLAFVLARRSREASEETYESPGPSDPDVIETTAIEAPRELPTETLSYAERRIAEAREALRTSTSDA